MLELRHLEAGYAEKPLVSVPHFTLKPGEHCLVLGPSGCGKTTLLYTIAGLLPPLGGEVLLEGRALAKEKDEFRARRIGVVHQTLHMVAALSVLQNVMLAAYAAGLKQDETRALEWLDALGLSGKRRAKPQRLSQGERQRVAIARAAVNAPALLIADEPTSALDDASCATAIELLLSAAARARASLVVATHDARILPHFTQRIAL